MVINNEQTDKLAHHHSDLDVQSDIRDGSCVWNDHMGRRGPQAALSFSRALTLALPSPAVEARSGTSDGERDIYEFSWLLTIWPHSN